MRDGSPLLREAIKAERSMSEKFHKLADYEMTTGAKFKFDQALQKLNSHYEGEFFIYEQDLGKDMPTLNAVLLKQPGYITIVGGFYVTNEDAPEVVQDDTATKETVQIILGSEAPINVGFDLGRAKEIGINY